MLPSSTKNYTFFYSKTRKKIIHFMWWFIIWQLYLFI